MAHERRGPIGGEVVAHGAVEVPDGHRIERAHGKAHRSVLALLIEAGITSIRTSRPSLEEVYVHLIGERGLEL